MQIPIQNIYYLLCYAWNKLDAKNQVSIDVESRTELIDLFASILINATKRIIKKGIDKNYIDCTQEFVGIKGKFELSQTLKENLLHKQRTICTFVEFSSNIIANRILVTTINRLVKTKGLDSELKYELVSLQRMLFDIEKIELSNTLFKQVKIHRNNQFYAFIMDVCKIIYENTLPTEQQGRFKFNDFTRDDRKMNQLFEAFVRNYYRIEQQKYSIVRKEIIKWQFESCDTESQLFLPQMETDITLENDEKKIIIDAKYYRETMTLNYDREKIKSTNLYQLFSYLLNQQTAEPKTQCATGILLYPTIEKEYNLDFKYKTHNIQIRTINLNADWRSIASRLKEIISIN